jgi:hypothetical protein
LRENTSWMPHPIRKNNLKKIAKSFTKGNTAQPR